VRKLISIEVKKLKPLQRRGVFSGQIQKKVQKRKKDHFGKEKECIGEGIMQSKGRVLLTREKGK